MTMKPKSSRAMFRKIAKRGEVNYSARELDLILGAKAHNAGVEARLNIRNDNDRQRALGQVSERPMILRSKLIVTS